MAISDGSWSIDPVGYPLPVGISMEGEEFYHHLRKAVRRLVGSKHCTERRSMSPAGPRIELAADSNGLASHLWLLPSPTGILVQIRGSGQQAEDQIKPWVEAVQEAVRQIGLPPTSFQWAAVVGPRPSPRQWTSVLALNAATTVGSLRLRPCERAVVESSPVSPVSLTWRVHWRWWPIIVIGRAAGYAWGTAKSTAAMELHRLCALMSLEFDTLWTVREEARPSEDGVVRVPQCVPWETDEAKAMCTRDGHPRPLSIPEGLNRAWELIAVNREEEQFIDSALATYGEGFRLQDQHPSFALLAYVTTIELIGRALHAPRPKGPRTKRKGSRGEGAAFLRALEFAIGSDEARELSAAYNLRCGTAHRGELHGLERHFGGVPMPGFVVCDPRIGFAWGLVERMRSASRRALRLALGLK